jgi:hypothetical protein
MANIGGNKKGASAQQNSIANSQTNFMSTLMQNAQQAFAGSQNIINGITKAVQNTISAGPSQFGFSAPELTALNTTTTSANAQAYQNARAAAGENLAATGEGANLPSGSQSGVQANLAEEAAQNQSNSLLGIQEAGYKQGVQNYNEALSADISAGNLENPAGEANAATGAGEAASSSANTIQKANAAASPWAQIGGLVGSLGGAALNAFVPGAGTAPGAASGLISGANASGNVAASQLNGSEAPPDLSIPQQDYQNFQF